MNYVSNACSDTASLPRPDALWLLPVGAVRGNGCVYHHDLSVLFPKERSFGHFIWRTRLVVPTVYIGIKCHRDR